MTFGDLNISITGLLSSQTGLSVTSENIANANTEGYSKKDINFAENELSNTNVLQGRPQFSGVKVSSIERVRNLFIDQQIRSQLSSDSFNQTVEDFTVAMNNILGEPADAGIVNKVNEFFAAAEDLSTNPESATAMSAYINAASSMADSFNQIDNSFDVLTDNVNSSASGQIDIAVENLNSKLSEIQELSVKISTAVFRGFPATDMEDARDVLIDEVRELIDAEVVRNGDGSFLALKTTAHASDAVITGSNAFPNYDAAIGAGLNAPNNFIELTVDNGDGSTGPTTFTVTFEDNSSINDVVEKINRAFQAHGGQGKIASLDNANQLSLQTSLIDSAVNSATASIEIGAGSNAAALTTLGLPVAGTTQTGSAGDEYTIVDITGVHYNYDVEFGNNNVDTNPSKLILRDTTLLQTKVGNIDLPSGEIGGLLEVNNKSIPDLRDSFDNIAMNIIDYTNKLSELGTTTAGNAGAPLFIGNDAGSIDVNEQVVNNNSLLATGITTAVSDNSVIDAINDLFFGSNGVISDRVNSEQLFIDSSSAATVNSVIPLTGTDDISITAIGLIEDDGALVNAGVNDPLGTDSLLQVVFLDNTGTPLTTSDFPASAEGAPNDTVAMSITPPAGAAFVSIQMNGATFGDADLTNNEGFFQVSITQGNDTERTTNYSDGLANMVGKFGNDANLAISRADNSEILLNSLKNQRESVSGVSLEEEAANLIKFQTAFSANSRVMNVWNEIFETVVNII